MLWRLLPYTFLIILTASDLQGRMRENIVPKEPVSPTLGGETTPYQELEAISPVLEEKKTPYQELEAMFQKIIKPKEGNFFHSSLRFKRYTVVKKNLETFKDYASEKNTEVPQGTAMTDAYEILHDKILWVDDFSTGDLKHFSSPYYANIFFKKHKYIINKKAESHKRKENE